MCIAIAADVGLTNICWCNATPCWINLGLKNTNYVLAKKIQIMSFINPQVVPKLYECLLLNTILYIMSVTGDGSL